MNYFIESLLAAFSLITSLDANIYRIVLTSVYISITATLIAALLAIPAGVAMALNTFTGKASLQHLLNTLMSMPLWPV
jgi:tungstate transport system permease protein